jgi:hypothetical protein
MDLLVALTYVVVASAMLADNVDSHGLPDGERDGR